MCWTNQIYLVKSHAKVKMTTEQVVLFYGLFLATKTNYVLTINEFSIIQQVMTFKGFNDNKRLLDRSQYFDRLEGKKISAMLPRSW